MTAAHLGGGVFDVKAYGAVGDGVTDDTAAFTAWAAAIPANGRGIVPPGDYQLTLTDSLSLASGVIIEARGATFTRNDTTGEHTFIWEGSLGSSENLAANASRGDTTVTVTSGAAFSVGDVVYLTDGEFGTSSIEGVTDNLKRFMAHVTAVAGAVITLSAPLLNAYTTADTASLTVVNATTGAIHGGKTVGGPHASFHYAQDVTVRDVAFSGVRSGGGVAIARTLGFNIDGVVAGKPTLVTSGNGYGVSIAAGFDGTIGNVQSHECRHGLVIGDSSARITGGNLTGNGNTTDTFNTHGQNVQAVTFNGVVGVNDGQDTVRIANDAAPDRGITVTCIRSYYPGRSGLTTTKGCLDIRTEGYCEGQSDTSAASLQIQDARGVHDWTIKDAGSYGASLLDGSDGTTLRLVSHDHAGAASRPVVWPFSVADGIDGLDIEVVAYDTASARIVDSVTTTGRISNMRIRCRNVRGTDTAVLLDKVDNANVDILAVASTSALQIQSGCTNIVGYAGIRDPTSGSPVVGAGASIFDGIEDSDGALTFDGRDVSADGTKLDGIAAGADVTPQAATATDASTTHALSTLYDDAQVEAALDALGARINEIIDNLQAAGLMA